MTHNPGSGKGVSSGAPNPNSCARAAIEALVRFSEQERLFGAAKAHDSFDGILTEHALALEDVRDELREAIRPTLRTPKRPPLAVLAAFKKLDEQITYIRALGSVAATEEEEDAK